MKQKELKDLIKDEVFMSISEGNILALESLEDIKNDPNSFNDIMVCDSLGIRGIGLGRLYKKCCGSNIKKFERTLEMFKEKVYKEEEILKNLENKECIPFIDDTLEVEGVPSYDEEFNKEHEAWNRFSIANKKQFDKKMEEIIEEKSKAK